MEIRKYQLDSSLPVTDHKSENCWSVVDEKKHLLLLRVAKVAMTCFHGPVRSTHYFFFTLSSTSHQEIVPELHKDSQASISSKGRRGAENHQAKYCIKSWEPNKRRQREKSLDYREAVYSKTTDNADPQLLYCYSARSTEVCHLLSKQRVQDPRTSFRATATSEELPSLLCKGRCDRTHSSKTHEISCYSRHPPTCKFKVLCQESHRKLSMRKSTVSSFKSGQGCHDMFSRYSD